MNAGQHTRKLSANRRRGEIVAHIDDAPRILCLTLGALAELEDAFEVSNLSELAAYFSDGKFSANDLISIIGAGLRGGGNLYSDDDVRAMTIDGGAFGLADIAAQLLTVSFSSESQTNINPQ